jgi:hypothetical protein
MAMARNVYTITGTERTARPFSPELSSALDKLIIQLETGTPSRWQKRILRLRKLVLEHRALGRAG